MTAEEEDWRAKRAPNGSVGQRSRHSGDQRKPEIRLGGSTFGFSRSQMLWGQLIRQRRCVFARQPVVGITIAAVSGLRRINGVQTWPASTSST